VPLLVIVAAALAWLDGRWAFPVAVLATAYAGGVGIAVASVDDRTFVGIEDGPIVTVLGATAILVGAAVTAFATFRRHAHPRRSDPDPHLTGRHVRDR
jgi:hypothetical protein